MSYQINKGINRPIEFKELKATYIGYLGGDLIALFIFFAVLYLLGTPVYGCIIKVLVLGSSLFYRVFALSHKYGQHIKSSINFLRPIMYLRKCQNGYCCILPHAIELLLVHI